MQFIDDDQTRTQSERATWSALWISPLFVIVAFAAGLIMSTIFAPPNDGDLWWQAWLGKIVLRRHAVPTHLDGETFTAAGAPWVAHEWLFSTALAAASEHGAKALFELCVGGCALGALIIVAITCLRRGATALATSVAVAVALMGIIPSLGLRAQVVAWLFMAGLFAVLAEPKTRWWSVPITFVWANVHASALLAPATIALFVAADLLERRKIDNRFFRYVMLLLATTAAMFATPLGWRLPAYAIGLVASPIKAYIVEWQSPMDTSGNRFVLLLVVAILLWIALKQRNMLHTFERITLLMYFGLAISAVRHLPVFFLFAMPIASVAGTAMLPTRSLPDTRANKWIPITLAPLMLLVGIAITNVAVSHKIELPYGAVRYVISHSAGTRLYCSDYSWCGMLVGKRGVRVYLDGRADPYPPELWAENARLRTAADVEPILNQREINVVLVAKAEHMSILLRGSKNWRIRFQDLHYRVYGRK